MSLSQILFEYRKEARGLTGGNWGKGRRVARAVAPHMGIDHKSEFSIAHSEIRTDPLNRHIATGIANPYLVELQHCLNHLEKPFVAMEKTGIGASSASSCRPAAK
ncbi:hypothetical protein K7G19_12165 [Cupriavidus sp. DB3]|uniref:hypothetical protein n=1 Tax=Cupriavidus sp. DB3 TaxID=2873259 RepID=UPI001CF35D73|nr:hypothetical protein [Cupriavidus sp. DB3]MCA7084362.1 hypothetical protein [Cupriavidus sp. DB3]